MKISLSFLMIFLIVGMIVNKILDYVLKKSMITKEENRKKRIIPALNFISMCSYIEFKNIVKEYLLNSNFSIKEENHETFLCMLDDREWIVLCKQYKDFSEGIKADDIYLLISELNSSWVKNGFIISNGNIEDEILNIIEKVQKLDIKIEVLEGRDFLKVIQGINEQKILKGE